MDSIHPNAHLPPQLRRVHALLAGGTAERGALTTSTDDLDRYARIIDAWDDDMRPLTRREVAERAGLAGDPRFDAQFDLLVHYGAIVQHRRKSGTIRYTPDTLALVAAEILSDLVDQTAADRLADLVILALDRIDADDITGDELTHIASRLARTINAVTATIDRAVDLGTPADLIEATPSARAQQQVARVADLVSRARKEFDHLTPHLRELAEASNRFAGATDRLVERLTVTITATGAGGLLSLLDPGDVDTTSRVSAPEALQRFAQQQVFDAPHPFVAPEGLTDAAVEIGAPPPQRTPPPLPDAETAVGALDVLDDHRRREKRQRQARRRWAIGELADNDHAIVADDVWPAPMQRLVDALALTDDPTVPVAADIARHVNLNPHGSVAANHPIRLRRVDERHEHVEADSVEADA